MFRLRPSLCHPSLLVFLVGLLLGIGTPTKTAAAPDRLPGVVSHGGYLLERDGCQIAGYHPDTPLVPASIWKIATGLHALTLLGPDFCFETRCYYGPDRTLYLQGSGDPLLTSEEIALLAGRLRAAGVREVRGIVLDDSAFRLSTAAADGASGTLNPYDVANSGLAVNFNTIHLTKTPDGAIRSAEPQTPTLPLMVRLGKGLPPGTHRINISQNQDHIWRYAGELLSEHLRRQGIAVTGSVRPGPVPVNLTPIYRHVSTTTLAETIRAMLEYSNNFIANQLFLACGAKRFGSPATWDKGREAMTVFLREQVGLAPKSFTVEEGSGLSRKNRVTPRAMLALLNAFRPHAALLATNPQGIMIKSGTLNGVYTYAGYFPGPQGLDPFVLMLNQPRNHRDQLLRHLEAAHQSR